MRVCLLPLSSIPVAVWIFFFQGILERVLRVWIQAWNDFTCVIHLMKEGREEKRKEKGMKDRSLETP